MSGDTNVDQALEAYFDFLLTAPQDVALEEPAVSHSQAPDIPVAEPVEASSPVDETDLEPEAPALMPALQVKAQAVLEKPQPSFANERQAQAESETPLRKPLEQLLSEAQLQLAQRQAQSSVEVSPAPSEPEPIEADIAVESAESATPQVLEVDTSQAEQNSTDEHSSFEHSAHEPEADVPQAAVWQNIEEGDTFQALFFSAGDVVFAVPLSHLGGIHHAGELTAMFGQAPWYLGVMVEREHKINVVDTLDWVLPGNAIAKDYKYVITLGAGAWGLSCEHLIGTETLRRNDVKWRSEAGRRPWLAGMVKEKMCALLHVEELERMLVKGLNIAGQ